MRKLPLVRALVLVLALAIPAPGFVQSTAAMQSGATSGTAIPESLGSRAAEGKDGVSRAAIPDPPEPAASGGKAQFPVETAGARHWGALSRIGLGADVSPLGFGIKSAVILSEYFDGRLDTNLYFHERGRFEIEGFNVEANIHMASMAAKLDWYPRNSIWRLTPGLMFFNGNRLSAALRTAPGTSFDLNRHTYYSATPNPATGATSLTGDVAVGLNSITPAFTASGGFGRFVPHSRRHWSFPSEFGVVFMGVPSLQVHLVGWACKNAKQTVCGNVEDPADPVAIQFNNDLQRSLARWRRDLGAVTVYPIFSYGFMYSFNTR